MTMLQYFKNKALTLTKGNLDRFIWNNDKHPFRIKNKYIPNFSKELMGQNQPFKSVFGDGSSDILKDVLEI